MMSESTVHTPQSTVRRSRFTHHVPRLAHQPSPGTRHTSVGFTLIEIMIAIGIFSMVLAAIYSSWTAILRASKTGLEVAASVQRMRIAVRMLEDSLGSAQSFAANLPYYYLPGGEWESGHAELRGAPVPNLPAQRQVRRPGRPAAHLQHSSGGRMARQLVLRQMPSVMEEPDADEKENPIVLVKNVKSFEMQFLDANKNPPEWVEEWTEAKTNQLPQDGDDHAQGRRSARESAGGRGDHPLHQYSVGHGSAHVAGAAVPAGPASPANPGGLPGQPGFQQPPPPGNPSQLGNPDQFRPPMRISIAACADCRAPA